MSDDEENAEQYFTPSKAYLTDSGASNHMVASRKSFITFPLVGCPRSHMGYESKIPTIERGSHEIQHDEFIPSTTEKQIVEDKEEAEFFLQSIRIEESLLGVTPSPTAPKLYEISDISSPHMDDPEEDIQIFVFE